MRPPGNVSVGRWGQKADGKRAEQAGRAGRRLKKVPGLELAVAHWLNDSKTSAPAERWGETTQPPALCED